MRSGWMPLALVLVVVLIIAAYLKGRNDVLISEMKTYQSNLIQLDHWQTNFPPELKEFMKGRFYYIANSVPKSWVPNVDYGPVDTNISHLSVGKGPTTPQEEYRKYKLLREK
jgi:hypothetical protein